MKHSFPTIAALAVSLIGSVFVPAMKADEWDKKTNIAIDHSIGVEGTVLPAGSYVVKLFGSPTDRHIVQIFNADDNHLIATILAIPAYRLEPTGDSEFTFYEGAEGQPPALRTWFYPGDNLGLEFRPGRGDVGSQTGPRTSATTSNTGGD